MARIRTIKPEFWTDETIVKLPFIARLLFIGMWNFADDTGALDYSPDRLRLQILPAENDCDISSLIDLLQAAGLIDYWASAEGGTVAITIRNWSRHQKIDNPSRKTIIREDYRKKAIPSDERVGVAKKYGCKPGQEADAACYYCGMPGKVIWWNGSNGKPSRWITLSDLEFDHFVSEHSGGESSSKNIVLACRSCNRGKREFDPHQFFAIKNPSIVLDTPSEKPPLDQGPRTKDQGQDTPIVPTGDESEILSAYREHLPHCQGVSVLNPKRRRRIRDAIKLARSVCAAQGWPYEATRFWHAYFSECARDPWMRGEVKNPNNPSWKQNLDVLIAEDRFAGVMDRAIERLKAAA